MMRKKKSVAFLEKENIARELLHLTRLIHDKRILVEPVQSATGKSADLRREAVLWMDRAAQILRESAQTLRISLPNPRKEGETQLELLPLLPQVAAATTELDLIWSSAKEALYPLAVRIRNAVSDYCTA